MARLPNFLVIIRSEKLSGKGQGRGAKKRTFRFGKKNVSFPKVETFRFADYTYDGGALNYIRKELIDHVQLCPCCSNSSDFTLDHYMPQSSYKALSVCRLNLIPMCGVCNNLKNGKTYSDFLHAYYDKVPEQEIIKAKVWIVKKRFVVKLKINDSIITDPVICNKIKQQVKELQIMQRLNKAAQQFIANLCISCSCTNSEGLKEWIDEMILHYDSLYGITDWRCAVLRGIKSCEQLDIDVVLHNKNNPRF